MVGMRLLDSVLLATASLGIGFWLVIPPMLLVIVIFIGRAAYGFYQQFKN
jgi:hypothetical protein